MIDKFIGSVKDSVNGSIDWRINNNKNISFDRRHKNPIRSSNQLGEAIEIHILRHRTEKTTAQTSLVKLCKIYSIKVT